MTTKTTDSPSPVRSSHLPLWLKRLWQRHRPADAVTRRYARSSADDIFAEIDAWLMRGRRFSLFDHWGSTEIDGQLCLVNEPYATIRDATEHLQPLADLLGCEVVSSVESYHGAGTIRVLLFPPS
jgi:hypothetical protein